ncbi:MAG: 2-succinyl-5-enolpyruvyl-6-hydroxy-3-cyclohexene-1-carboxylic-acid synthase [Candidatus Dormibacteria bacterium]
MPDAGDVALACCMLLVDELVRGGARHACMTAGSRSTPLVLAVARNPAITLHVHVDERSSSYYALGIAKASGAPAIALCSSGTAAANHFPAVVEASMAREPLIVLTADRPPELHGVGANQAIDQQRLFGDFVRLFADAGVPDDEATATRRWRALGARAVAAALGDGRSTDARWPPPGPVHINMPFREPLVPSGQRVPLHADSDAAVVAEDVVPWTERSVSADDVGRAASLIGAAERVVVVAGTLHGDGACILDMAQRHAWPVLAEPTSLVRCAPEALSAGELLVIDDGFRTAHRADVVLQLGAAPTSRAMQSFVREAGALVIIDPDDVVGDPERRATVRIVADARRALRALDGAIGGRGSDEWMRSWRAADAAARAGVDALLDSWDEPFEGRIAGDLASALPSDGTLVVASSMPVRDLTMFMAPGDGVTPRVLANRGASGIDGTVSTALGVAAVSPSTYALIGDLALLHDASALLWSAGRDHHAVIVVVDNDGGGIFSLLSQAQHLEAEELERLFTTPHGAALDIAALARASGAGYREVTSAAAVIPALRDAQRAHGVELVHVRVDRSRARAMRDAVRACVRDALQRAD